MKRAVLMILAGWLVTGALGCGAAGEAQRRTALFESAVSGSTAVEAAGQAVEEDGCLCYYYGQLPQEAKGNYQRLLKGLRAHTERISGLSEDQEAAFLAVRAVYLDHPELIWLQNGSGTFYYGFGQGSYEPFYRFSLEEGQQLYAQAQEAAARFLVSVDPGASDYQKVKAVFEYLVDRVDYSMDTFHCANLYGALVEGQASCLGYSAAAQYLLKELGLPCAIALGDSQGDGHAWNLVWVDGEPYHMDVTWGDPSFTWEEGVPEQYRNYAYMLASTQEILYSRTIDETLGQLPLCSSDQDNFFVRENLVLEAFPQDFEQALSAAGDAGQGYLAVRFSDTAAYEEALSWLIEQGEIFAFLQAEGIDAASCSYAAEEEFCQLTIFWK